MTEPRRPALLGLTAYFLLGLTLGVTYLIANAFVGWNAIGGRIGGGMSEAIQTGAGLVVTSFAILVFLPLLTAGVSALMGRHGGRTHQRATGAAALTTLLGIPLIWINFAIAALLVSALLSGQEPHLFDLSVELLAGSLVQMLLITGPLVALAALVANRAQNWAEATEASLGWPDQPPKEAIPGPQGEYPGSDPNAWESSHEPDLGEQEPFEEGPAAEAHGLHAEPAAEEQQPFEQEPVAEEEGAPYSEDMLTDHPVDCPRCGRTFTITGVRPLRIECPDCGKTGTIQ